MENHQDLLLDVTQIEPKRKHPTIFELFDQLPKGGKLTILNDHDPKPLYYQLLAERGQIFQWKYLENGPQDWKVEIMKNLQTDEETIGQISKSDIRKIEVFKKYGIDFCCGGNKTLRQACQEKGLELDQVKAELEEVKEPSLENLAYHEWKLDFLSEFIVHRHHAYIRKNLPVLLDIGLKVSNVHGQSHPELKQIYTMLEIMAQELNAHIQKEEVVLFPYIKYLQKTTDQESVLELPSFGSVNTPVNIMLMEHESAGEILENMKHLSDNFKLPDDACNSYRYYYQMLSDFDEDLRLHIHLENNILFPSAIELEKKLLNK